MNDKLQNSLISIKNGCIRRRLTTELKTIYNSPNEINADENKLYVDDIDFDSKGYPIVKLVDCESETNVHTYEFHLKENYPFNVPKIFINGAEYYNFLRIRTTAFQQLLRKITGNNCLCCHSYMCGERWSPALRLINIVDEIRLFRKYKRDIINKFYADKIQNMYLFEYAYLASWLV